MKIFHVHKEVLVDAPFFKNTMKPEWSRQEDKVPVDLTDEDSTIVEIYLKWLYSHNLPTDFGSGFHQIFLLYVLGEKLMHCTFQDAVLRGLIETCESLQSVPNGSTIKILYNGTTAGSPARQLMVDMYCWRGEAKWADNRFDDAPAEFMRDCMRALMGVRKVPQGEVPWEKDVAQYFLGSKDKKREE